MKDRPILFSAPMVRAILAGTKTQTRRMVRPQPAASCRYEMNGAGDKALHLADDARMPGGLLFVPVLRHADHRLPCPYGAPGDRLWVRETHHTCPHCSERTVSYRAGGWMRPPTGAPDDGGDRSDDDTRPLSPKCAAHGWRPSIHMPYWARRITLEVTSVRVERLQDITEEDARAEGLDASGPMPASINGAPGVVHFFGPSAARQAFSRIWQTINGKHAPWASNPWVWVVGFKRFAQETGAA